MPARLKKDGAFNAIRPATVRVERQPNCAETSHRPSGTRPNLIAVKVQPCDEGVIRSSPAVTPCSASDGPWILATTILGSSLAFIDGSVVNLALPALQAKLSATVVD